MRQAFAAQLRLDISPVAQVSLNLQCRDEIVPILFALQHIFSVPELRKKITDLVAADVSSDTRRDVGRPAFDDWQVAVLAALRMGCNLDYDKLQDLGENHRGVRGIMAIGEWDEVSFDAQRLCNTLHRLSLDTLKQLNHIIVSYGQGIHGQASQQVRADSFVVETNIHYPTESSLIWDGMRKIIPLGVQLADVLDADGWRQHGQLRKRIKQVVRSISRLSARQTPPGKEKLSDAYRELLDRAQTILDRAKQLIVHAKAMVDLVDTGTLTLRLQHWIDLTVQVCDTTYRRIVLNEQVPNADKLFSLFETHTQLYRRGKAGQENQFGRMVLIFEDGAGFISHYHLMARDEQDVGVVVEQTREAQRLHGGKIKSASFDRGFYSAENAAELAQIIAEPCLPARGPQQYAEQLKNGSVEFKRAHPRHAGVEAAIGVLQAGNGLKRCRDKGGIGLDRYLGLAVLGRNLHQLGKLLIARLDAAAPAGASKRLAA